MPSSNEDSVSYADIAREALAYIRFNGRIILVSGGLGLLAAFLAAHFTPLKYKASVMVAAQEGLSTNSSLGNLEDLAGLAGSTGGSSFQPFQRFTQTLTNDTVAHQIIKQPWVLPTLFSTQWDTESKSWHPPPGPFAAVDRGVRYLLGLESWHPPSTNELRYKLEGNVQINKFGRNPVYTISFQWKNPVVAGRVLNLLLETNDSIIQHDARARLASTIAYLQQRLRVEKEISRRNALSQILLEQERSLMAAEANGPYAAKVIDRMSVTVVAIDKAKFGIAVFLLISLLAFCGLKFTQHLQHGESFRGVLKVQGEQ